MLKVISCWMWIPLLPCLLAASIANWNLSHLGSCFFVNALPSHLKKLAGFFLFFSVFCDFIVLCLGWILLHGLYWLLRWALSIQSPRFFSLRMLLYYFFITPSTHTSVFFILSFLASWNNTVSLICALCFPCLSCYWCEGSFLTLFSSLWVNF